MVEYPEVGEFVLASVNKMMPYGAFCSLDEYAGVEAFLHISEVSSGWVKNIRDFVKEGQKIVAVIARVDKEKRQIDLSLKRVSEADRRKKLEGYQLAKRADKLLERASIKIKKNLKDAYKEVVPALVAEAGDLYSAFEMIKAGTLQAKLPVAWHNSLKEVAEAEIKEKLVEVRAALKLQSFDTDGVERIKEALQKVAKLYASIEVHYLGAPNYFVDYTAKDYKEADKMLAKTKETLDNEKRIEFSLEKIKG